MITVSIVSHGHGALLSTLLADLWTCPEVGQVIVTLNTPEPCPHVSADRISQCRMIENREPKGFGENHNHAFRYCQTQYFAVLNPDIRLSENPFSVLLECLGDDKVAVAAPAVTNPAGSVEDSAREFPSLWRLAKKAMKIDDGSVKYRLGEKSLPVQWVAGMFMVFKAEDYVQLGGFDEGYYLYYEDVDICVRLWNIERRVMLCPAVQVVHDARRASHRQFKHMLWHLSSMVRYLWSHRSKEGNRLS